MGGICTVHDDSSFSLTGPQTSKKGEPLFYRESPMNTVYKSESLDSVAKPVHGGGGKQTSVIGAVKENYIHVCLFVSPKYSICR